MREIVELSIHRFDYRAQGQERWRAVKGSFQQRSSELPLQRQRRDGVHTLCSEMKDMARSLSFVCCLLPSLTAWCKWNVLFTAKKNLFKYQLHSSRTVREMTVFLRPHFTPFWLSAGERGELYLCLPKAGKTVFLLWFLILLFHPSILFFFFFFWGIDFLKDNPEKHIANTSEDLSQVVKKLLTIWERKKKKKTDFFHLPLMEAF